MLGNETQDVQAKAFVEWINTCPNVTHECHSVEELSNGIPLFEVLAEIDPVWFKLIRSADVGENWVLKINNLKKMHRMISRYYEDILGIPFERMPHVDLTAIAKDANRQEIFKLCQLVLFITVTRDNNAMVVERLQGLSEQSQRVVMLFIEEVSLWRPAGPKLTPAACLLDQPDPLSNHRAWHAYSFTFGRRHHRLYPKKLFCRVRKKNA
ncbi:hypothetical protein DM01DRAFT_1286015 [Hesseltinella vesiculosa]|uniref:Calponin-homology (CH) domain-containing protein n=1 Tax=Hesseltinella vesiculosa TaxID=101127 RepID=A0A1X2GKB0_9FUNG|nr:hypothetical protein DM01DRAFT_1286015 [Hesseltinella vesiculosa]